MRFSAQRTRSCSRATSVRGQSQSDTYRALRGRRRSAVFSLSSFNMFSLSWNIPVASEWYISMYCFCPNLLQWFKDRWERISTDSIWWFCCLMFEIKSKHLLPVNSQAENILWTLEEKKLTTNNLRNHSIITSYQI